MHLRFCISQWPFFIALWAFIFLIVGEILIRSISPQYSTESLLVEDENLGWKINIELNPSSQGFLEEEINLIKHRDKKLMYAVGDSYAYGIVPYEDNYLTIVDSNFIAIDIINLGVPMYGPQQYFHIIQKFTDKQTPDYVLLNLFVGNDYEDKNNKREFIVGTPLSISSRQKKLFTYSHFIRDLYGLYRHYQLKEASDAMSMVFTSDINKIFIADPTLQLISRDQIVAQAYNFAKILQNDNLIAIEDTINSTHFLLNEINEYVKSNNGELIVVIIPDRFQYDEALRVDVCQKFGYCKYNYNLYKIQQRLTEELADRGIDFIDLLPDFQIAAEKGNILYQLGDTHWNNEGNVLASKIITGRMEEMLELNTPPLSGGSIE